MANPEHVAILKQGVEVWNEWRMENTGIFPDLSEIDLINTNFDRFYLRRVNFSHTNLEASHFVESVISWADFSYSNLTKCEFWLAQIYYSNFFRTIMSSTHFVNTGIMNSIFDNADMCDSTFGSSSLVNTGLISCKLEGSFWGWASISFCTLNNLDLSNIKGLDKARYGGPSSIGIDTIYKSQGKIPPAFLKGCGVPDQMIEYIGSLVNQPIQYYSCFISYSSKDDEFAKRLYEGLQNNNVRCWFAPEDLKIGDRFRSRIDESIRIHDKLLLILSENSVKSDWVEKEVETAMERERKEKRTLLFPVKIDDAVMDIDIGWAADIRRTRHIGDFTKWKDHDSYKKGFERLLKDLKAGK